jgi:hypothetical protein
MRFSKIIGKSAKIQVEGNKCLQGRINHGMKSVSGEILSCSKQNNNVKNHLIFYLAKYIPYQVIQKYMC